jgi:hypothetical protein
MTWVAVAVGGGAVVGGLLSSSAAKSAANTQANSANAANQLQWNMFQQQQENQKPWLQAGTGALGQLTTLTGPGGEFSQPLSMSSLQTDPGFAFRMQQGQEALDRSGAARGMTLSGAQVRGLTDYGQGQGSQEYQNAWNRAMSDRSTRFGQLASMAGLGQAANAQMGQMGMQTAGQMGNNITGAGAAQAAGQVGSANAWTSALNTGLNGWQQYNMLQSMNGGGYGGSGGYGYGYTGNNANPYGTTGNIGTGGAWASAVPQ